MYLLNNILKFLTGYGMLGLEDFGGGDKEGAEQGITATGQGIRDVSQMTPEEKQQYLNSFGIGQNLQQAYQNILAGQPSGFEQMFQAQGPLTQSFYNQIYGQAQNPYAGWESSLAPNLALVTQNVNQQSNQRGLLNSGINLESLGRAGLEQAVLDAQNRMAYGQQSLQNAGTLASNIYGQGQNNLANLYNLYNAQQGYGQQARGLQTTGAINAAQYQAYPYQAQLGNYYGGQAALQALPGQIIGAAGKIGAAYASGGTSLMSPEEASMQYYNPL